MHHILRISSQYLPCLAVTDGLQLMWSSSANAFRGPHASPSLSPFLSLAQASLALERELSEGL